MFAIDTDEPFGLPRGTVRGVIALAFTGTFIYMGVTGQVSPDVLMAAGLPFLGYYVADRKNTDNGKSASEEPLPEPYVEPADAGGQ